jgi:hypothetical protein
MVRKLRIRRLYDEARSYSELCTLVRYGLVRQVFWEQENSAYRCKAIRQKDLDGP